MPHALSLPFRSLLSLAANRPMRTLGVALAVIGIAAVIVQVAMAAVTLNPLKDGNDVVRTPAAFKVGDVIKADGAVDNNRFWKFVRISGTTATDVTSCVQATATGPVNTTYTVPATDAEGAWTFELRQGTTAARCNSTNSTQYDAASRSYTVDKTVPTVSSVNRAIGSPTNHASVSWTVTFSESVHGVDAADFALAATGLTGSAITNVTGSGTTWTVTADTGSGEGTLGLNVVDSDAVLDDAGNDLTSGFTGQVYEIDRSAPTVTSIDRANGSPTNAASVSWTVTFSDAVTGVDTTDFALSAGNLTGASVTGVTGSGTIWTVTAGTGSGAGTLGLSLVDDDTITDIAGNGLTGGFTGQTYSVDRVAPTVTSIDRANASPTTVGTVSWTVTFSENVTGVGASDFTLAASGPTGTSITGVTGSGDTRTVTASTGSGSGSLGLNLVDDDTINDAFGNGLAGGFSGQVYTIDRTGPAASAISRANVSPTNAGSVTWTVAFTEAVTGVDATDFTLAATGITGAAVTNVTGSGSSRTVTVSTGSGTGTLGLNLIDDDTIADGIGNTLGAGFTGQLYSIDTDAPEVDAIDRAGATPTNTGSVTWTVTFSETVTGVDATDFALAASGITGASITDVAGTGATRTVTADTGSGSGTLGLNLVDDDTILDALDNTLGGGFTGQAYTLDRTAPTVDTIDRADASPTNDGSVSWTVTFGESVTGVDAADFTLDATGLTGAAITNVSGSGTTYTVTAGTGSGDGALGLDLLDDDTILDDAGNALAAGLAGQSYTLDRTAPTVDAVDRADSTPANVGSVGWTVTFSESVTGVDAADFALAATGITGASIGTVTGSGDTRTVTVNTGSGDGTLGLNLVDDDVITDAAGNELATGRTGEVYDIDKTVPTVQSIALADASPTKAGSVDWDVTFSEAVTGVDAADFTLAASGLTGTSITTVTGGGTDYTVTADTGAGSGTLGLNLVTTDAVADAAGNDVAAGLTGQTYTLDRTAPTVLSIDRADASPTNAGSVDWTVTFSESVTGVDETDFALAATGVTGATVDDVTGSGDTRTVTVLTGSGNGTLRLDALDDDTIVDGLGTALAGGFTTGEAYTLDRTAPAVASIDRADASPTNDATVSWTVTFTKSVTGVDAADFALAPTGVTGATISSVTGSGTTWTVTAGTGSGAGTLGLNLVDDDSITDDTGNTLASGFTGQTYEIDLTAPTVQSITRSSASPTNAGAVSWTVTFSETVTGVGAADFALAATGVSGTSITSVTGTGATRTVTAGTGAGNGTLGLNLVDDDTIADTEGNDLAGGLTGQVYAIDKTVPTAPAPAGSAAATPPVTGTLPSRAADKRAPLATLSSKVRLSLPELLRKGVKAGLLADENATATLQLTLQRAGKRIVLGTATATLTRGVRSKVTLKLTKKGKAQLSKVRGTARLSLRVTVRDAAGNAATVTPRTLTVKR